ncbi:MAG TPA: PAS domain S-box protein, partial [Anaerolineales bacterium]|nr:PAS domain S-box protein [Anaerolineales bacterium]
MDWLKTAVDPRFAAIFRRFEDGPFYLASFYGEGALHGETMPPGSAPWEWLESKNIPLPRGYRYTLPIGGPEKQNGILAVISARRGKKLEEEKLLLDQALASLLVFGHGEPAGGVLVGDEQYRTLFENAPIGIGVVDTSGTFLAFNDAILKPGGYTREDIRALGNVAALYYDNRDREQVLGLLHKQGFVHQFPVRFKRRDGKPYDALLTLRPIQIEGKRCIQALVEDVTERKCAENSLRESEEKYRAFVEQLPAVVYVDKLDGRGTTTFVSPQIEDLFGLTVEEWLKGDMSTWLDMVHPEDRQMALDAYHGLKEPGGQYDVEYRVIRRDKRQVWIQDRGGVLKSASGELYLHGVLVDITERKTRERELEAEAMLAQALGETLELQPLLERLLEAAQFAIPAADKGSILLAEPDGSLCIHALHGYKDARLLGLSFSADSGYAARAALERKPLLFSGVRSQPSIRYDEEIEDAKDIHSAIAAPLMIQDRVIGVISLDATEIDAFTEEDLRLLAKFATAAALIVERANLFEETRRRV